MTFKLTPRNDANNRNTMLAAIQHFKMAGDAIVNGYNVYAHLDGKISIDSGYKVLMNVTSIPIEGEAPAGGSVHKIMLNEA